ncbi:hypothetical protein IEQ34_017400 [Dendrobium chrysotoxum]|uniref:Uncharacterized protein n=1 Tax=Dendrobium chrysotoxum TaxID=161865 RepID=A0AAV7G9D2_DENCH|nr:hypothetical protein IEQ34_017400 [Dendrobium chrysotoxum]
MAFWEEKFLCTNYVYSSMWGLQRYIAVYCTPKKRAHNEYIIQDFKEMYPNCVLEITRYMNKESFEVTYKRRRVRDIGLEKIAHQEVIIKCCLWDFPTVFHQKLLNIAVFH